MWRSRPAPVSRANAASSASKKGFDRPVESYHTVSPLVGCKGDHVQPSIAGVPEGDRPLAHWGPDPALDRLQAEMAPFFYGGSEIKPSVPGLEAVMGVPV